MLIEIFYRIHKLSEDSPRKESPRNGTWKIKCCTLRKLDLEIQKLEREVNISVFTVTITAMQCLNICICSLI